eukprot:2897211-Prymnesium_polylepis.1
MSAQRDSPPRGQPRPESLRGSSGCEHSPGSHVPTTQAHAAQPRASTSPLTPTCRIGRCHGCAQVFAQNVARHRWSDGTRTNHLGEYLTNRACEKSPSRSAQPRVGCARS